MYAWGPAGGFLLALLSGSREYTEVSVAENFKKAGLSHILALSGMHLSMFSGLAVFLGTKLRRKRITLVFQLVSVSAFVWFAGFSPSLLRAFICLFIVLFQGILSLEKSDMLTVLCFSFFTQCMISPNDLLNTGFILSYGALCENLQFLFSEIYIIFSGVFNRCPDDYSSGFCKNVWNDNSCWNCQFGIRFSTGNYFYLYRPFFYSIWTFVSACMLHW